MRDLRIPARCGTIDHGCFLKRYCRAWGSRYEFEMSNHQRVGVIVHREGNLEIVTYAKDDRMPVPRFWSSTSMRRDHRGDSRSAALHQETRRFGPVRSQVALRADPSALDVALRGQTLGQTLPHPDRRQHRCRRAGRGGHHVPAAGPVVAGQRRAGGDWHRLGVRRCTRCWKPATCRERSTDVPGRAWVSCSSCSVLPERSHCGSDRPPRPIPAGRPVDR